MWRFGNIQPIPDPPTTLCSSTARRSASSKPSATKRGKTSRRQKCYHAENRHERKESERFRYHAYADLVARDKASLNIFWLKDSELDNLDDLPAPDVLQQEIIEHLEAALLAFRDVAAGLPKSVTL